MIEESNESNESNDVFYGMLSTSLPHGLRLWLEAST